MISIVLPTYNGEKYIQAAVDSILCQTYHDFELIIVDDCSTDRTYEIVEEYKRIDRRVRVIHNKVNQKLPASLNIGFKAAKGELHTWTSDDNIWMENMLERLLQVFDRQPGVDLVYANIVPIDQRGKIIRKQIYRNGEIEEIYFRNPVLACFLYKKEVFLKLHGFNTKTFLWEDYNFWLRAYEKGFTFYHLNQYLYYYRYHCGALSESRKENCRLLHILQLWRNQRHIGRKEYPLKREIWKRLKNCYREDNDILRSRLSGLVYLYYHILSFLQNDFRKGNEKTYSASV